MITKADCAQKILAYLNNQVGHTHLVQWAWEALQAEEFPENDRSLLMDTLMDLSASDTAAFSHRVEDYHNLLGKLGYRTEGKLISV